eukprot:CAMPEP_0117447702 /NCGR_PEP_ID=MMETSP0759-20121206/7015_1 /TAXON_ID=63605 /ORGANISM="Percolomonas cosmopolitus, Strain WS" /LENGTH=194 /DNA_ID=CAMNT_0005240053 /DNA_START=80 /DNA_END=662 /DNA_ORIENTATION=+
MPIQYFLAGALGIGALAFAGKIALRSSKRLKSQFAKGAVSKMKFSESGFEPDMSRMEAARILGVSERAEAEDIKKAHRKLMIRNHPDSGGSTFLSSKINEAKDMLLEGGKKDQLEASTSAVMMTTTATVVVVDWVYVFCTGGDASHLCRLQAPHCLSHTPHSSESHFRFVFVYQLFSSNGDRDDDGRPFEVMPP